MESAKWKMENHKWKMENGKWIYFVLENIINFRIVNRKFMDVGNKYIFKFMMINSRHQINGEHDDP